MTADEKLLVLWFRGTMTEGSFQDLHRRLGLTDEWGADLEDTWKLERGIGYLPNDGRYRAQLRLRRTSGDEEEWRFEIWIEGQRPPEETIAQWRTEITAAATEAGLHYERDWLQPVPQHPTPPLSEPVRTSRQVHVLYRAYVDGQFTADTLDAFRDALGIEKEGRIDDDAEQFFGERYLREEENRLIRLIMGRISEDSWYLSLSYQDTPPDTSTVTQVAQDIRAAATRAGLAVSHEQNFPPQDNTS